MVVFHHNDNDGRCAAAIVRRWVRGGGAPKSERLLFVEMGYNYPVSFDMVQAGEVVYVLDFHFKPEDMKLLRAKAKEVVWCDHHASCKDFDYAKESLPGKRDFSDKGLSGCELTWQHLYITELPLFVKVLGDYDAWRLQLKPDCFEFYEGLKLENAAPDSPVWSRLFGDIDAYGREILVLDPRATLDEYDRIRGNGRMALLYRNAYCADMCKVYGYEAKIDGILTFVCNIYRFGSQGFGVRFSEYPICAAYVHDGAKFIVSLYSEVMDVSVIAAKFGGGGHKGAAGFTCTHLPWVQRPEEK